MGGWVGLARRKRSPMSEDLIQSASAPLGRYQYLRLGATTLAQLKRSRYIRSPLPDTDRQRKPDGIVFLPLGGIKAVIEVKPPAELKGSKLEKVIEHYRPIAAAVCNLLIVTDGKNTYWVNAHTGNYVTLDGKPVREHFPLQQIEGRTLAAEVTHRLVNLIDRASQTLSPANDALAAAKIIDPSQLANTVWQKIWVTTGKEPEKCLYNVVEIFVFKFLSDTGVLTGNYSFKTVVGKLIEGDYVALDHYARVVRPMIRRLFPEGDDGTTIINGTIFVNEKGEPNSAQATLFAEVLRDFQSFDNDHGSMQSIDRQFKTRLFESFLRQSAGVKSLGQYFTPRNVVQAMVRMSPASKLVAGARICDPFCGVGGFILETIAENPHILREFEPRGKKVRPRITLRGYDKGTDEKDDERTIILAKANMLIYFSDLLGTYNDAAYLKEFSNHAFNVFLLIRNNLGSFSVVDDEPYDLILTNPPYVTSGSRSLRLAIDAAGLSTVYPPVGRGTESIAIQWVIRNLKPGGKALVVVPDGLMNQSAVINIIKDNCIVDFIGALPTRTFFSTPKKTYILEITKKNSADEVQTTPVMAYLVSDIGESRDARRIPIDRNDLIDMVDAHNFFMANKAKYEPTSPRCKILDWTEFSSLTQWLVERHWSQEERSALGLEDEKSEIDEAGFMDLVASTIDDLQKYLKEAGYGEDS